MLCPNPAVSSNANPQVLREKDVTERAVDMVDMSQRSEVAVRIMNVDQLAKTDANPTELRSLFGISRELMNSKLSTQRTVGIQSQPWSGSRVYFRYKLVNSDRAALVPRAKGAWKHREEITDCPKRQTGSWNCFVAYCGSSFYEICVIESWLQFRIYFVTRSSSRLQPNHFAGLRTQFFGVGDQPCRRTNKSKR
jgi:hypothetical protein